MVLEEVGPDGDIEYRDDRGVHHVPKRALGELSVGAGIWCDAVAYP